MSEPLMIGIFGLPCSGKSAFRRHLVKILRDAGLDAGHWDADQFDKHSELRCPEDADCAMPDTTPGKIWLVEDVRGLMPLATPKNPKGAHYPLDDFAAILYLRPDRLTYEMFWLARALRWQENGRGDLTRESGSIALDHFAIMDKVRHNLSNAGAWTEEDERAMRSSKIYKLWKDERILGVLPELKFDPDSREISIKWNMLNDSLVWFVKKAISA